MPITNSVTETQAGPSTSGSEEFPSYSSHPLCLLPNTDHTPDNYEDLNLNFSPLIFSAMERHLHPDLLNASREVKVQFISNILNRYNPNGPSTTGVSVFKEYHDNILSKYKPLHKDLYTMNAEDFFVPDFVKAVKGNTKESYRKIMAEPLSGVFIFDMFQQRFCQMLLSEVENFQRWAQETEIKIMRPNKMNKVGAVLDDFGLKNMLNKMVKDFISPITAVLFSAVGGTTLDSHHSFVVEYEEDSDLAFHVDDAEVTLNVCLGKKFSGGELYFRGVRCNEHIDSNAKREEIMDYVHVPGRAILHHGRNRHGVKVTKSGHRANLLVWCRSSFFRRMHKYETEFPDWCGECQSQKKEMQRQKDAADQLGKILDQESGLYDGVQLVIDSPRTPLRLLYGHGSEQNKEKRLEERILLYFISLRKPLHEMFNKYWRDTYLVMTLIVAMIIFHFPPISPSSILIQDP